MPQVISSVRPALGGARCAGRRLGRPSAARRRRAAARARRSTRRARRGGIAPAPARRRPARSRGRHDVGPHRRAAGRDGVHRGRARAHHRRASGRQPDLRSAGAPLCDAKRQPRHQSADPALSRESGGRARAAARRDRQPDVAGRGTGRRALRFEPLRRTRVPHRPRRSAPSCMRPSSACRPGLALAADGTLFVGDRSGSILRVSPDKQVETFASLPPSVAAFHLAFGPDECPVRDGADARARTIRSIASRPIGSSTSSPTDSGDRKDWRSTRPARSTSSMRWRARPASTEWTSRAPGRSPSSSSRSRRSSASRSIRPAGSCWRRTIRCGDSRSTLRPLGGSS